MKLKNTISIIMDDLFTCNVVSIDYSAREERARVQQIRILSSWAINLRARSLLPYMDPSSHCTGME